VSERQAGSWCDPSTPGTKVLDNRAGAPETSDPSPSTSSAHSEEDRALYLHVIGAGYVGLVTAVGFAKLGHRVTVTDVDARKIGLLRSGQAPIFEPGLEEAIRAYLAQGRLDFRLEHPTRPTISMVCVNTPRAGNGPLSTKNVEAVVSELLAIARPADIIVIRSTLPLDGPATIAQMAGISDRRPNIVTNPEFMREGHALDDFDYPARVVVGWLEPSDRAAAEEIATLYAPLHAPVTVADARSVALIKLATNVFLAAKVALTNEMARICDALGADVDTVAAGVGADPRIGREFLTAGPGYGGSCLPEQALALAAQTRAHGVPTPLVDAVSQSNETHQRAIVRQLERLLDGKRSLAGRRVAILGLTFKANTDDVRESPALALARYLREAGVSVTGYDPRGGENAAQADPELSVLDTPEAAATNVDAILLATEWRDFATLDWNRLAAVMRGDLVYDTRKIAVAEQVREAGLRYHVLGRNPIDLDS
jgi:UDPglucose 6-dehydrogenase